jgi:DNA-binding LacI/PurR family transcriptional regulator
MAMNKLLSLPTPPTAVFCYNDMTALGVLRAIHMRGLRVPSDISVIGFDDLFFASYTQPRLTTVRQPMRQMGRMALESLLHLMSGEQAAQSINVPAELIIRESTAAPRGEPR